MGEIDQRGDVQQNFLLLTLCVKRIERTIRPKASIIDQDINATEILENPGAGLLDRLVIGDIDRISLRSIGAVGVDFIGRPLRIRLTSAKYRSN